MTDADYTAYLALLANTPTQAKSILHSLEQAARNIGINVKIDKNKVHVF